MAKDYGRTPSEMLNRDIISFLFDWECTILLREKENEATQASKSGYVPPRIDFEQWEELVKEDIKREKREKRRRSKKNK